MSTSITIELTEELMQSLNKIAETEQVSVSQIAEAALSTYLNNWAILEEDELGEEELAILDASVNEAEQPGAIWYSDDEAKTELDAVMAERRNPKKSGAV